MNNQQSFAEALRLLNEGTGEIVFIGPKFDCHTR